MKIDKDNKYDEMISKNERVSIAALLLKCCTVHVATELGFYSSELIVKVMSFCWLSLEG